MNSIYIQEVENEILSEISKNYGSKLIDLIGKLPDDQKRIAMFAAISSKKDTSHKDMLNTLKNDENSVIIKQIDKIIERFRKYIPIGDVEKKSFGEVFTPFTLVNEMLDTLPVEVWSNPNLKWADLCNGMGNFMIMVVKRLMIGLESWQPNEAKRYKHIIENMVYVAELQPKNMFLWMLSVDPKSKLNLNIYTGNSLESGLDEHMKNVWKVDKFDIIVGNPPYNEGTKGGNGQRDLWDKFIFKFLKIIEKNGYLVLVHPSKWRRPESEIFNEYKKLNLIYLEIHSKKDGQKIFGAITRYDFYLLQNSNYSGKTIVIDEKNIKNIININDWNFLPNYNYIDIKNIITLKNEKSLDIIYSRSAYGNDKKWMSKNKSDEHKYPCIYGMYKDLTCSYYYSSIKNDHFNIPKIILGTGEKLYPLVDINGEYGMMQNSFGIKINSIEDALNIKNAIESDKFKKIIESTKWLNFQTDYKMFKYFREDFWKEFID